MRDGVVAVEEDEAEKEREETCVVQMVMSTTRFNQIFDDAESERREYGKQKELGQGTEIAEQRLWVTWGGGGL